MATGLLSLCYVGGSVWDFVSRQRAKDTAAKGNDSTNPGWGVGVSINGKKMVKS